MTLSQSKLMIQLNKEQKITHRYSFNQEQIEELYNTICKLQPKNLMLVEFLTLIIERDFIKNSNKLMYFTDLYEEIKGKNFDADQSYTKNTMQVQEQKFSKKKFIKMMKQLSKKMYAGNINAYQTVLFQKLTKIDTQEHRIKIDEPIRKMLTRETIITINDYDTELQTIFEVYMPENYNSNLEFSWQEIKILEKKLPIICCLRFLYQTQVVPHFLSAIQFMQIVGKLKPPLLPSSSSSKEAMFYTSQTIATYLRDHISSPQIKLLEGDVGFTFFEFQIFLIKVATEFSKDSKHEYVNNIKKFVVYTKLKEAFDESASRRNKFMQLIKIFLKKKSGKNQSITTKKRESKKKIEDLYDSKELENKEEDISKSQYKNIIVQPKEIQLIKKDLDGELPDLPLKKKVQKENEGYFDVDKKHVVIGEQLPKIQQKAKISTGKQNKKKTQDAMLGYKPQVPKAAESSDALKIISRPKKLRANTQFPIVLNQIFYPSDLKNQLFISPKAEVYLQTSYIHLGQRLYEQAFISYIKAKSLNQSKSSITEYFYNIHGAQIFESAGKDEIALSFYHRAKDLFGMLTSIQGPARAHPYIGMGACLYHLDEYQLAYRCFQKAKTLLGINLENDSLENAILHNNIGCCLMMLNRNQEAVKYFETSHKTFDQKVGVFDQRSLVVQQNANKNRKAYLQLMPEFKTMWKTYIEKSATKLPAVKPNKQKK